MKLVALDASNAGAVERLLTEPMLSSAFEGLARPGGVVEELSFPHLDRDGTRVATVDGEAAGFAFVYTLPIAGSPARWALISIGVGERFRRRGLADRLLAHAVETLRRPGIDEITMSGWLPAEGCAALAGRHGFRVARHFWLMERPLGEMAEPAWPAGLEPRTFGGSDCDIDDLNTVYNDSFADHYHFVPGSDAETRDLVAGELFRADGLAMSYRGERCVGFCRCTLLPARGEISMLGTAREARGIGLGRALLRWGVRWLEREGAKRVTLVVDGENESALRLYRQEGFEVARTRRVWSREP